MYISIPQALRGRSAMLLTTGLLALAIAPAPALSANRSSDKPASAHQTCGHLGVPCSDAGSDARPSRRARAARCRRALRHCKRARPAVARIRVVSRRRGDGA